MRKTETGTMEELSFKQLCSLFCCPPCNGFALEIQIFPLFIFLFKFFLGPSRITAKMAFLPPKITYDLNEIKADEEAGDSSQKADTKYEFTFMPEYIETGIGMDEKFMKDYFDSFYTKTKRGNKIACLYIKNPKKTSKYTILFSHGNAADLGMLTGFYCRLVHHLNVDLFSYDYSGYGRSTGKPSEKNLYADVEAAWHELIRRYDIKKENIILYGQSIGTAPVVDLGTKVEPAGVVLHSPLMSGIRLLFPVKRTWLCDAFPIIDKISKIKSPTLVIHGTHDEIISFSHGLQIYDQCQNAVEPLWVKGAGHNDIEQYKSYFERLLNFMKHDLKDK
jgi:abhydrolase domain-containing protein 17